MAENWSMIAPKCCIRNLALSTKQLYLYFTIECACGKKHQHLLEIVCAIPFHASLSIQFWRYCILAAFYLINLIHSSVLARKTTFEVLHRKRPYFLHLHTLGSMCFASVLPYSDRFAPRAESTIFLGYSLDQKGYIVMTLCDFVVHIKRDVVFHK